MKKHFAKEGFFYGFLSMLAVALTILGLAASEGRLPFAVTDGRIPIPLKEWEFMVFWMATAVSLYCRGAYDYRCRGETKTGTTNTGGETLDVPKGQQEGETDNVQYH